MISLRIWAALLTPFVAHPLYQRWGVWTPSKLVYQEKNWLGKLQELINRYEKYWLNGLILLVVISAIFVDFWTTLMIVLGAPIILMTFGIPTLLLVGGTIYGLTSALLIGNTIINEKIQQRYELIGLSRYGFEGLIWALCSLSIQRSLFLKRMREYYKGLFFLMMVIFAIPLVMLGSIFIFNPTAIAIDMVTSLILGALGVLFLSVEFVQSSIVGSLIGILAPHYAQSRMDTRNIILSSFIVLQLTAYITIGFFDLLLYPQLFDWLGWNLSQPLYQVVYVVVAIITFYLIREVIIVFLWHRLADIINVELYDIDLITHVGIKKRKNHTG